MTIYELVQRLRLLTVTHDEMVLEVARKMVHANVGAVPVLQQGALVGIFSERDLMRRVVVQRLDPATTKVGEVMTTDPLTITPEQPLEACMALMKQHNVRHLPICDDRRVVGIVSLRDVLLHDVEEKSGEVQFMRAYIQTGAS